MRVRRFLDTNVLLYAYDLDAGAKLPVGLRVDAYFLSGGVAARTP